MKTRAAPLLLLALALSLSLAHAQLFYNYAGKEEHIPVVQLWLEGNWQKIPSLNGTTTWNASGDLRGKIVLSSHRAPHEPVIRDLQRKGAAGIVFYRPGTFPPGFGMYIVDGSNRSDLAIPVLEATYGPHDNFLKLPEGTSIQCVPTENLHKKFADTKFQLVMNLVHSFWEMAIAVIAAYRLYQFYFELHSPFFSIAPLCCMLEGMAALIRLAYTVFDPFYTYRVLTYYVSIVLVTLSWPFSEAAGILLTFFWAETLTKSNIQALPFISDFKKSAIVVTVVLFLNEAALAAFRAVFPRNVIPVYVSSVVAFIVEVALVVCYLTAAVAIVRRIGNRGKAIVRKMTIRIVVSSVGYFICIAAIISFAVAYQNVMGRSLTLNAIFLGLNLAGLMQVLALRPAPQSKSKSSSQRTSSKGASTGYESARRGKDAAVSLNSDV